MFIKHITLTTDLVMPLLQVVINNQRIRKSRYATLKLFLLSALYRSMAQEGRFMQIFVLWRAYGVDEADTGVPATSELIAKL